jgi:1-acyl-sn-glycerol-3-phosphate acyltransferase
MPAFADEPGLSAEGLVPVRHGYAFEQPDILLRQRLFGLAHGVHLLLSGCLDKQLNVQAIEQAYEHWHTVQEPAIEALRRGISIVIAPEGTRSPTPRLGPFKKGAFHLAMAAKRPIVPIVFKNTLDVLPKHGTILRPATVEVVVHKPIATTTWTRRSLDRHVEEVHRLFEATLEGRKA